MSEGPHFNLAACPCLGVALINRLDAVKTNPVLVTAHQAHILRVRPTQRHGRAGRAAALHLRKAEGVLGDLATDEGANQVAESAQKSGPIDILVNNAGAYRHLGWMEGSPKVWAETYQVNVISAVRMIQKLVPEMRKTRSGRVIQGATKSQRITGIFLQFRGLDIYA